jgi:ATP-dependent RNA helicase DDX3X
MRGPPRGGGGGGWVDDPAHRDDPFEQDAVVKAESDAIFGQENTGINFDAYEDIPVEASGRECPAHVDTFDQLQLPDTILRNIQRCKYTKPTPVQRYAIPIGLAGRDIMACAQTGSGKTAAFCFPIISGLIKAGYQPQGRGRKAIPAALILAPTRELTSQIYEEARKFAYQSGIRPVVIYGGAPVGNQVRAAWLQWQAACALVGLADGHCGACCAMLCAVPGWRPAVRSAAAVPGWRPVVR